MSSAEGRVCQYCGGDPDAVSEQTHIDGWVQFWRTSTDSQYVTGVSFWSTKPANQDELHSVCYPIRVPIPKNPFPSNWIKPEVRENPS